MAIGHFGNFELYARIRPPCPIIKCATTYRALNQPALNRLHAELRGKTAACFLNAAPDGAELRDRMNHGGVLLGLLADQSSHGLRVPFLGHDCNTGLAPAVLALRYHCRTVHRHLLPRGPGRMAVGNRRRNPTHENGRPRPSADIMRDVNRELEAAVRRDPANWFWVHRRWKE